MRYPLTESLSNKIANFLQSHEGCTLVSQKPTSEGAILELRDVFGFQYTIEMKATSRIQNDQNLGIYELPKKPALCSVLSKAD